MKYREAARKLQALGCHELPRRKGGSHRKWFNPITGKATVLPDWGGKDLKWGTSARLCASWGLTGRGSTRAEINGSISRAVRQACSIPHEALAFPGQVK